MTELELSLTLGLIADPDQNRVSFNPWVITEIAELKAVFERVEKQKLEYGAVNPDIWCEFLPWLSLN
jgi:hypothetical protein